MDFLIAAAGAMAVGGMVLMTRERPAARQTEREIERTGQRFSASVTKHRADIVEGERMIRELRRQYGGSYQALSRDEADPVLRKEVEKAERAIASLRARIRSATTTLDDLHHDRDREVRDLRLERALGGRPPELELAEGDCVDDADYRALAKRCDETAAERVALDARVATLEQRATDAMSTVQSRKVSVRLGEAKPHTVEAAERAATAASAELARARDQRDVLDHAVSTLENKCRAREQAFALKRLNALQEQYRATIHRAAAHMRNLGYEAIAARQLLTEITSDKYLLCGGVRVPDFVPRMIEIENPEAPVRRWLDSVVDAGWVDDASPVHDDA